jgi:hypothetical protein
VPIDQVRNSNQDFFRIAAAQRAGPAVGFVIDYGNTPTGRGASIRHFAPAGSGADDNQIVRIHPLGCESVSQTVVQFVRHIHSIAARERGSSYSNRDVGFEIESAAQSRPISQ